MHLIYVALSYLLIGGLLPLWALHPKLRQGIGRRLGRYGAPRPWPAGNGPRIWLHGASAGDLLALLPIIIELRARAPEATLIVSMMTNSGFAMATERLASRVNGITFVPYDLWGSARRAVDAIQPDVLVLEYAELWPNLLFWTKRRGAKIALTNGRLSEALVGRYRFLFKLIGNQLQRLDLLMMREEVEAERARTLGAVPERVCVTGNTKFDNLAKAPNHEAADPLRALLNPGGAPLFVAGSTHEGEEGSLIKAFLGMRKVQPSLRMLIAPRYVERGPRIAQLCKAEELQVELRSEERETLREADVIVLDTIGELNAAYALGTLVFVGGSFIPRGGQNILEPAGHGLPVLFGPYMMNFRDSVEVLVGRGGIQVKSFDQLERVASELLARPEELERLGAMAKLAVQRARGASAKNAARILELVSSRTK